MRTRFNNNEIGHIWANNTDQNREGKASNCSFRGPRAYSYGHYLIAFKTGRQASCRELVLFRENGYSNTTKRHISHFRRALDTSRFRSIYAPCPDPVNLSATDHSENIAFFYYMAADCVKRAKRALRHGASYMDAAQAFYQDYIDYAQAYELPVNSGFPVLSDQEAHAIRDKAAQWEEAETKRQEAREARAREINMKHLEAWRRGDRIPYSANLHDFPVELRLIDGAVETSWGARVDIEEALKAIQAYQAGTLARGVEIGPYTFDHTLPDGGVKIGCHVISKGAIEALVLQLNKGLKQYAKN